MKPSKADPQSALERGAVAFRYHKGVLALFYVGAVFFLAIATVLAHLGLFGQGEWAYWGMLVLIALAFVLFVGREWFRGEPVVVVDAQGVRDRRLMRAPVPWLAIRGIRLFSSYEGARLRLFGKFGGGQENLFVGLIVDDPERYYSPANPLTGALHRFFSRFFRQPLLAINMSLLDGTPLDLVEAIENHSSYQPRRPNETPGGGSAQSGQ